MVDYCVRRFRRKQEEKQYRSYIADVLMTLNNNLVSAWGGMKITTRYMDLNKPVDTRTGDEIAEDVMKRAGLTFAEEDT